jgi:hypothetical protein
LTTKDTERISWIFVIRLLNNMDLQADFVAPNFDEALLYTHAHTCQYEGKKTQLG